MDYFERVKILARASNTTIEAIAFSAGLTRNSYNSYRNKGNLPRADEAVKMAHALKSSVEFLVEGKDSPQSLATLMADKPVFLSLVERLAPLEDDELLKAVRILEAASLIQDRGAIPSAKTRPGGVKSEDMSPLAIVADGKIKYEVGKKAK
jgi:transcriptional regulator with XRE-family HTH domain